MKIGIIRLYCGESGKSGYYNLQELGLARGLKTKGIDTDIFFLVDKNEISDVEVQEIEKGIRIIYVPAKKIGIHGVVSPKFILEYNIDIVHLAVDNQLIAPKFIKFLRKNNIKYYCYIGSLYSNNKNIKQFIMKLLLKRNLMWYKKSNIISKNNKIFKQLIEMGVNNCKIIPVGLDLFCIPKVIEEKSQLKEQLGFNSRDKVIIYIGRLTRDKRPIEAFNIIENLITNNEDYKPVIIGDGELREDIKKLISKSENKIKYSYIPKIKNTEIHKYLKVTDVFINTSEVEIFGMAILEAMYHECKVFAKTAPGPNQIIDNFNNGFLIDNYDIKSWSNLIENNIENDKIGQNANKAITNYFNWEILSDEFVDFYSKL
ncbi:group 1 glycosyl transferase [Clostridium sartagoforme AAU1]|uniref:Group 1 glycosyl transferase n=1 Tax=Clostridium sartagoforme AAU1 TaxID=1202534 RepID=R9CM39_9CLOT|nr:glycosyltransferase [Clostridium sartagoforme]EOR28256.1 group 1 glycosyl transferase [Clostridium sartagoforme AAU1]